MCVFEFSSRSLSSLWIKAKAEYSEIATKSNENSASIKWVFLCSLSVCYSARFLILFYFSPPATAGLWNNVLDETGLWFQTGWRPPLKVWTIIFCFSRAKKLLRFPWWIHTCHRGALVWASSRSSEQFLTASWDEIAGSEKHRLILLFHRTLVIKTRIKSWLTRPLHCLLNWDIDCY